MCLAIPSRVERIDGLIAVVEAHGHRREVNLMLLDDEVALGDYLLISSGGLAFERLDAQRALEALALIDAVVDHEHGTDLHAW